ncbi:MAG: MATE family efflux transporter [Paracoccaceae bacterium]
MSSASAETGITHRRVLNIAIPIVLANVTVPLLGIVDTGVVGQMGDAAPIGAVGIGATIVGLFYWMFGFLRMGTVGLTGQARGAGDTPEVAALLTRALLVGVIGGVALILLQVPLFAFAFFLSPASAEVESLATGYMAVRIWSAPAAVALFGITGWLIAQERTRGVLLLQLWMNGLNILLDVWFVLGLGWGVSGVAFATFLAEWSGLALGLFLCRGVFKGSDWRDRARVFDRARWQHMASLNSDILARSLLLEAIFVSFLFLGARFGDVTLAANQVLKQFVLVTAYGLDGFAFAAEALVGQALGARNRAALRRSSVLSSAWAMGVSVAMGLSIALFGVELIEIMAKSTEVQETARIYLIYLVFVPILSCAAFMLDGIFVGATRSRDMRNMMFVSFVVYLLALAALLPLFGNHGLWMALLISFIARGVTLGLKYPALERLAERSVETSSSK